MVTQALHDCTYVALVDSVFILLLDALSLQSRAASLGDHYRTPLAFLPHGRGLLSFIHSVSIRCTCDATSVFVCLALYAGIYIPATMSQSRRQVIGWTA